MHFCYLSPTVICGGICNALIMPIGKPSARMTVPSTNPLDSRNPWPAIRLECTTPFLGEVVVYFFALQVHDCIMHMFFSLPVSDSCPRTL